MDCHCIYPNDPVRFRTQADNGEEQTCRFNVKNNDKLFNTFSANKLPYQKKKSRHKIPSVKKIIDKKFRHWQNNSSLFTNEFLSWISENIN